MNNSNGEEYDILIQSWKIDCRNYMMSSKTWSGINPFYDILWPNNILLNSSLLEKL